MTESVDYDYDLPEEDITSPAVHPPMLSLQLESHHGYPQVINIDASGASDASDDSCGSVTVQDVLRTIHEDLRIQLSIREVNRLDAETRATLRTAFRKRCQTEEEFSRGPCRIDRLGGRDRLQILPRLSLDGRVSFPTSALPAPPLRSAQAS